MPRPSLTPHNFPPQSAIDLAAYGLGATDEFQGTGVFSGFKMSRDKPEPEEPTTKEPAKTTTTTEPSKEKAAK